MSDRCSIELHPRGRVLSVTAGSRLQDVLFEEGVEFPCGGRGRCQGCRVRVLAGELPPTPADRERFSSSQLTEGWRLACQAVVAGDLRLELAQWEVRILEDASRFEFTPGEGLGIAIDLGTTTLVGQLLDLRSGEVLAVESALNAQARHGADIMTRVDRAGTDSGRDLLTALIRRQVGEMATRLLAAASSGPAPLRRVVLVGNTVMHHLFCGLDSRPLAQAPFESPHLGLQEFRASDLGWQLEGEVVIRFLPCLGGFVGSDLLAGLLATQLHKAPGLGALMDLGTNGEIVVGNRQGLLCASTAAGPAFEGARISMGMRAATGAIAAVRLEAGRFECRVLGRGEARGLCGSGLVDAVACGLESGALLVSGRLTRGELELAGSVRLTQKDIRELQLAKGAIAAGVRLLAGMEQATVGDLQAVHLAGAFGNYISRRSAERIGLLQTPVDRVVPAGNTALLGAKMALMSPEGTDWDYRSLRERVRHISLHEVEDFHHAYVEEMVFPDRETELRA